MTPKHCCLNCSRAQSCDYFRDLMLITSIGYLDTFPETEKAYLRAESELFEHTDCVDWMSA